MFYDALTSSSTHRSALSGVVRSNFLATLSTLPDPVNVRAVREFTGPRSSQEVCSFHGLFSYFQHSDINIADIAWPLTDLPRKKVAISWGAELANAFTALISAHTSTIVLAHCDPAASGHGVDTDASGYDFGAILAQIRSGASHVTACASRFLSPL